MKTYKSKLAVRALVIGAAAVVIAGEARATNYTIAGTYGAPGSNGATTDLESGWNLKIDSTSINGALVGDIKLVPAAGPTIHTVCVDIQGEVYLGQSYNYVLKTFASDPQYGIDPVGWGAANTPGSPLNAASANAAIQNAAHIFALHSSALSGSNLSDKAAVQIAVWAALYDTGSGLDWTTALNFSSSARFHASNSGDAAALATAINWLTTDLGSTGTLAHTQYSGNLYEPDPNYQHGHIAQEFLATPTPVPEPTTVLAGMLLLLPFGASTIRHIRKQRNG